MLLEKFKANHLFVLLGLFYLYEVVFNAHTGFGTDELITYFTVLKGIGAVLVIMGVVMMELASKESRGMWTFLVVIALLIVLASVVTIV